MNNMPNLSLIEKMIENDDLDNAERELTKLEKIIKAAQPADDEEMEDEDGEDEDDDGMQKLGPRTLPIRYPGDSHHAGLSYPEDDLSDSFEGGADVTPPTPTVHSPDTYATGVTPMTQQPFRHPFDDEVDAVMRRGSGSSRLAAMTIARLENPALFQGYQQFLAGQTTSQQAMARSRVMEKMSDSDKQELRAAGAAARGKKKKRPTHEDVVADEVAKGFDPVIAEQRVMHQFGNTLPRRYDEIAKAADSVVTKFMRRCDQIMIEKSCDRLTAMRAARQEDEGLYEAFQVV